jgi:hypothetical protein
VLVHGPHLEACQFRWRITNPKLVSFSFYCCMLMKEVLVSLHGLADASSDKNSWTCTTACCSSPTGAVAVQLTQLPLLHFLPGLPGLQWGFCSNFMVSLKFETYIQAWL